MASDEASFMSFGRRLFTGGKEMVMDLSKQVEKQVEQWIDPTAERRKLFGLEPMPTSSVRVGGGGFSLSKLSGYYFPTSWNEGRSPVAHAENHSLDGSHDMVHVTHGGIRNRGRRKKSLFETLEETFDSFVEAPLPFPLPRQHQPIVKFSKSSTLDELQDKVFHSLSATEMEACFLQKQQELICIEIPLPGHGLSLLPDEMEKMMSRGISDKDVIYINGKIVRRDQLPQHLESLANEGCFGLDNKEKDKLVHIREAILQGANLSATAGDSYLACYTIVGPKLLRERKFCFRPMNGSTVNWRTGIEISKEKVVIESVHTYNLFRPAHVNNSTSKDWLSLRGTIIQQIDTKTWSNSRMMSLIVCDVEESLRWSKAAKETMLAEGEITKNSEKKGSGNAVQIAEKAALQFKENQTKYEEGLLDPTDENVILFCEAYTVAVNAAKEGKSPPEIQAAAVQVANKKKNDIEKESATVIALRAAAEAVQNVDKDSDVIKIDPDL
eukprot:g834.t1